MGEGCGSLWVCLLASFVWTFVVASRCAWRTPRWHDWMSSQLIATSTWTLKWWISKSSRSKWVVILAKVFYSLIEFIQNNKNIFQLFIILSRRISSAKLNYFCLHTWKNFPFSENNIVFFLFYQASFVSPLRMEISVSVSFESTICVIFLLLL